MEKPILIRKNVRFQNERETAPDPQIELWILESSIWSYFLCEDFFQWIQN